MTDHLCYGCGEKNPIGLRIARIENPDGSVHAEVNLGQLHQGAPGVIHGGLQAVILDEVMGKAAEVPSRTREGSWSYVTAQFELKYRAPAATGSDLRAIGRAVSVDWPWVFVEGEILDASGEQLTTATARWKALPR